ncbi:hypothetical protein HMPREF1586_01170 [Gardnerella vaginalis JCP8522]|nr:hypothetical protein HMPREF1586_01170 [Gardnerella vaginalis JCP8522]
MFGRIFYCDFIVIFIQYIRYIQYANINKDQYILVNIGQFW